MSAIRSSGGDGISQDPESGQVFAKHGMTFRTWGSSLKSTSGTPILENKWPCARHGPRRSSWCGSGVPETS
jgi:hypothetical protein